MAANLQAGAHYRPSGKLNPLTFLPLYVLGFPLAFALALVMNIAFELGFYFYLLAPALASLPLAAWMWMTVHFGKCRNLVVAAGAGLLLGLFLYFSFYLISLLSFVGLDPDLRPVHLFEFIQWRMENDVVESFPNTGRSQSMESTPAINWLFFAGDLLICCIVTASFGIGHSRRPFSELRREWMKRAAVYLPPGKGANVAQAHAEGRLEMLADAPRHEPKNMTAYTAVWVDYATAKKPGDEAFEAYFSVKDVQLGGGMGTVMARTDGSAGKYLLKWVKAGREELEDLSHTFPELKTITGEVARREIPAAAMEAPAMGPPFAVKGRMERLEDHVSRSVLSGGAKFWGGIINTTVYIGLFVAFFMLIMGAVLTLAAPGSGRPDAERDFQIGVLLLVVGVPLMIGLGFFGFRLGRSPATRMLLARAREGIARRRDALVGVNDGAARAVECIPRKRWKELGLNKECDLGYLKLDPDAREVLFEGVRERWRIPYAAVRQVSIEGVQGANPLLTVQLGLAGWLIARSQRRQIIAMQVETEDGPREVGIDLRTPHSRAHKKHLAALQEQADRMREAIGPRAATI